MAESHVSAAQMRYERFAAEFLIDLNATAAYRRAVNANATQRTAEVEGHKLLRNPEVQALLASARGRLMQKLEVSQERVVAEYARIAFIDPRELMEWDAEGVTFHPSESLTPDAAAVVASVKSRRKVRTDSDGNTEVTVEQEMKLNSKQAALDSLSRHLGLFKPLDVNVKHEGGVLMVPGVMDADTWAKMAAEQQGGHQTEEEG